MVQSCSILLVNLSISNLSTSDFKLAKSFFLTKSYVLTPVVFLSQILLDN